MLEGGFDEVGGVGEDAGFEVAAVGAFHSYACPGEVGGADVGRFEVEDKDFEVYARTKHSFESGPEDGITVEVFLKDRAGLFGVDETDFDTALKQPGEYAEEGDSSAPRSDAGKTDVKVLDVGCANPQRLPYGRHSRYDL